MSPLFVAGFIGSPRMSLLPATVAALSAAGVEVELDTGGPRIALPPRADAAAAGQPVMLGVRPEALPPDANGPLFGGVRLAERLGGLTLLHVALAGGQAVVVQIEGSDPTRAHEPIRLTVDGAACHVFDAEGGALPALRRNALAAA